MRRRAALVAAVVTVAALATAGCTGTSSHPTALSRTAGSPPECPSAPYRPRATSGDLERPRLPPPAGNDVADGAFVRRLALDNHALVVDPPRPGDVAAYSGDDALCEVLASTTGNNFPVGRQSKDTVAVGLARVSVDSGKAQVGVLMSGEGHGTTGGVPNVEPKRPAPAVYRDRLAWVVVVQDIEISSCAAYGPGKAPTSTREPGHHGYAVFIVDASTGGDALLYTERRNGTCPGTQADGPWLDVPLTSVSIPWRLVSERADRTSAQVSFSVSSCDGYSGGIFADLPPRSAGIPVVVERPYGPPCSPLRSVTEKLLAGGAGLLPPHLKHAPTGPYIS